MTFCRDVTFAELEGPEGVVQVKGLLEQDPTNPLQEWYCEVLNVRLRDLSDTDLATAIGQNLWLEQILEELFCRVRLDPLRDSDYGCLVGEMRFIRAPFWLTHRKLKSQALEALAQASRIADTTSERDAIALATRAIRFNVDPKR